MLFAKCALPPAMGLPRLCVDGRLQPLEARLSVRTYNDVVRVLRAAIRPLLVSRGAAGAAAREAPMSPPCVPAAVVSGCARHLTARLAQDGHGGCVDGCGPACRRCGASAAGVGAATQLTCVCRSSSCRRSGGVDGCALCVGPRRLATTARRASYGQAGDAGACAERSGRPGCAALTPMLAGGEHVGAASQAGAGGRHTCCCCLCWRRSNCHFDGRCAIGCTLGCRAAAF